MQAIVLENVFKTYNKDNQKICAIKGISLSFEKGKFYAIMGNSGAGKSTLLQCIGLLDSIDSGTIKINNKDISLLNDEELSKMRKENIGFIFQSYYLNSIMKSYENVMIPMYLYRQMTQKQRKTKAINLLAQVGLEERIEHYPKELSGGEQQRVAIARALANDPEIILADEPTGNLDEDNEEKILKILRELTDNGKCVIVVSHNPKIQQYADVTYKMKNGILEELA